jgi:hypothetical protein
MEEQLFNNKTAWAILPPFNPNLFSPSYRHGLSMQNLNFCGH